LSEKDRTAFDNFRVELQDELKPNSPLLILLFDNLVACAWRVKQALRCEQMELAKQFEERIADDERCQSPTESPLGYARFRVHHVTFRQLHANLFRLQEFSDACLVLKVGARGVAETVALAPIT